MFEYYTLGILVVVVAGMIAMMSLLLYKILGMIKSHVAGVL